MTALPATADVVVIGGGILGLSIACHLGWAGGGDVVVVERRQPGAGATSRAAALLTRARAHARERRLVRATYDALTRLSADEGEVIDVHRVGAVHAAADPQSVAALKATLDAGAAEGDARAWISPEEARRHVPWLGVPWLGVDAATAIAHTPHDAYLDPWQLTQAYGRVARRRGARVIAQTAVLAIERSLDGAVVGVHTPRGRIATRTVVLAAGAWSSVLAAPLGVGLAQAPVQSRYRITAPDPALGGRFPLVILPDARAYARPEGGGLLLGVREETSLVVDPRLLPEDLSGFAFGGDLWEDFIAAIPRIEPWVPSLLSLAFAHTITGPSAYTPDGALLLGPIRDVPGMIIAAGCCGAGIAFSGGVGQAVADLVISGQAGALEGWEPERFGAVDPFHPQTLAACAAARSRKKSG